MKYTFIAVGLAHVTDKKENKGWSLSASKATGINHPKVVMLLTLHLKEVYLFSRLIAASLVHQEDNLSYDWKCFTVVFDCIDYIFEFLEWLQLVHLRIFSITGRTYLGEGGIS